MYWARLVPLGSKVYVGYHITIDREDRQIVYNLDSFQQQQQNQQQQIVGQTVDEVDGQVNKRCSIIISSAYTG